MTNYKEILRLHSLGINNTRIAESCGCARSTVISTVQRAQEKGITWEDIRSLGEAEVARKLYPATSMGRQYKMPDYEYIHREMQKSGVTLSLLWVEYCEQCQANGELPYQSIIACTARRTASSGSAAAFASSFITSPAMFFCWPVYMPPAEPASPRKIHT